MRHLRRQQARRIRGLPQRDIALGRAWAPSAAHRRRHARLRRAVAALAESAVVRGSGRRRIAFMATHAKTAARRDSRSALVINVSRLGRRPGSMLTVHETVPSPSRIGLDLIAIDEGAPLE